MARKLAALTDVAIRNAKPKPTPYKLFDGDGLFLHVEPNGSKLWRFKYRFNGKENLLSLGRWPQVSLAQARRRKDEARQLLAQGRDPSAERKAEAQRVKGLLENTFEAVALEWQKVHFADKAPAHVARIERLLQRDILPWIGTRPVAEITPPDVLAVGRRIEGRGARETARRAVGVIGQVIRYAVATGKAVSDPTRDLRGALPGNRIRHMPAPTDPAHIGAILRALEGFQGSPEVGAAIRLLPYLFVRPGELRTMRWEHVDLEAAQWRFVASKTRTERIVPLARQAVSILRDLFPITGHLPGGWVFPNARTASRPMSEMAINAAYRRLGIDTRTELTGHGWRAVARTLLHEQLGFAPEIIEHQLGHKVPDALGQAYNRTRFLEQRKAMMQAWADYLDALRGTLRN